MKIMTIMKEISELGAFGIGTLILTVIALYISILNNEDYGFKPLTTEFISLCMCAVTMIGAVIFIGGRGVLW